MARQRQRITLDQIENTLGYKIDYFSDAIKPAETTFYSDLTPVPTGSYDKALRELGEYTKQQRQAIGDITDIDSSGVKTISLYGDTVALKCTNIIGVYSSLLNIDHHNSGFHLPLRLTRDEASRVLTVAKFQREGRIDATSIFFKLPTEIRTKIYEFSIPEIVWKADFVDAFDHIDFSGTVGDPTGFYFPLGDELSILQVSKQIRQEALPIAYRRTIFRLDDMDEFVKVAVAIGDIGRANIESVEFAWHSEGDSQQQLDEYNENLDYDELRLRLPTLHAQRCVQLLKECRRLKFLRLYFEEDLISDSSFGDAKSNPGISQLASFKGTHRLDVQSLDRVPLDQCKFVKWLSREMKGLDGQDSGDEDNI